MYKSSIVRNLRLKIDAWIAYSWYALKRGRRNLHKFHHALSSFNPTFYKTKYPDLEMSDIDLYWHFVRHGFYEGRIGSPEQEETGGFVGIGSYKIGKNEPFDPTKKSILIVSHEGTRTGAPILSLNLAAQYQNKYNVVSLLLRHGTLSEQFDNVSKLVVHHRGHIHDFESVNAAIRKILNMHDIHFAIVNSIESRVALSSLFRADIPSVGLMHEFAAYTNPSSAFNEAIVSATKLVFSTKITRDNAIDCIHPMNKLDIVIPQGKCTYQPQLPQKSADGNTHIINMIRPQNEKDTLVVLCAGTRTFRKGLDLFIESASKVVKANPDKKVRFVWIGENFLNEFSLFMPDMLQRAGVEDNVILLNPVKNLDEFYKLADVFMLSSRLDPLPNVAIDAMSYGVPIVCFDKTTGIADTLKENGLEKTCVAQYLDVNDIAEKVSKLLNSKSLRTRIGNKLKEISEKSFNMKSYANSIIKLGREAEKSLKAEHRDLEFLRTRNELQSDYFINSHIKSIMSLHAQSSSTSLPIKLYLRYWRNQITLRKPHPGFNPAVYLHKRLKDKNGIDPLIHYVKAKKPQGPWTNPVIAPSNSLSPEKIRVKPKVCLHIHVFYPDAAAEIISLLNSNVILPDILISVPSEEVKKKMEFISTVYNGKVRSLKVVPNVGRDIGPMLTGFREEIQGYNYFGHIHTKKSLDVNCASSIQTWVNFLHQNLLYGKFNMLDIILTYMENNAKIGLVFPDDPNVIGWTKNVKPAEIIAKKLGIKIDPELYHNFPIGTMFWARTKALKPLFDLKLKWEDYPSEPLPYDGTMLHAIERLIPLVAEKQGYEYATTFVSGITR